MTIPRLIVGMDNVQDIFVCSGSVGYALKNDGTLFGVGSNLVCLIKF